ncbi:glycosyltransferase [Clostridium tagluense]|uniref:glycosyltransferase n=1 Tax=Clostridium tagluense TaxID=360422 RepID=UPI001C6EF517|nr:glycosyltransferase [Clostridium tagluense]MBW9158446.1 glycosyltransferase [Clostridium tagluense]WLC66877.1 glycosyltransferase [Clostridium tagluense]
MIEEFNREKILIAQFREKLMQDFKPGVSIIACTNKPNYIHNIFINYERSNYPEKELLLIINNNKISLNECKLKAAKFKYVKIFQLDETCTLGECLNFGVEKSKYDYISKMDDDDYYGSNYLEDTMNVFKYTDADITGKLTYFVYFEDKNTLGVMCRDWEYRYVFAVAGGTITAKKEVFASVKFQNITFGEDKLFLENCHESGFKIFSSDKYNYVLMRHKNLEEHTWKIHSEDFIKHVNIVSVIPDFASIISV